MKAKREYIQKSGFALAAVFFLLPAMPMAQDLKQALQQMKAVYDQTDRLHIQMEVAVFDSPGEAEPFYTLPVDIKKRGDNYFYHYGTNEVLVNQRYFIMADESSKEMVCGKRTGMEDGILPSYLSFDLDSILLFYNEPEYLGKQEGAHQYRLEQKTGPVSEIRMWIADQDKLLRRMDYQYRQGSYVKINFTRFDPDPVFEQGLFSEERFIRLEEAKLVTSKAYRQYHLVETVSH